MICEYSYGAVLYTLVDKTPYYVLVHEKAGHCGFPKGHIEPGEKPEETALREIREETGIEAMLDVSFSNVMTYDMPNGHRKEVTHYLASFENQALRPIPGEVASARLLSYEEAMDALTYENSRSLLQEAHRAILNRI